MAAFPYFGNAVHAVLPYMKAGGKPGTLTFQTFRPTLERWIDVPPGKGFSNPFFWRVFACWQYVAELVALADTVEMERPFANGKAPDLLLTHRGRRTVVEVKTLRLDGTLRFDEDPHTRDQVMGPVRQLARQEPNDYPVEGYVLAFTNDTRVPLAMQWTHMLTLAADGRRCRPL